MAKPTLPELVIALARARTQQQRAMVLREATLNSRFDEDQLRELNTLLTESRDHRENVHALRPLTNPVQDCQHLVAIQAGEAPLLPPEIWIELSDWVEAWNRAEELLLNRIPLPGALLLSGPTGTGKTMLTKSIAGTIKGRSAVVLDAHRVIDSHMGESGSNISKAFAAAQAAGSLLVVEELDGIAESRGGDGSGAARENNRVTIALLRLIEESRIPIIATTNRPESLDPALLRRFEIKLAVSPLSEDGRRTVLQGALDGAVPPPELVALPLAEGLAQAKKIKRTRYLAQSKAA